MNLYPTAEHPCSYLPTQLAREAVIDPARALTPARYQELLALGFRRSGPYAYRTACRACQACIAFRCSIRWRFDVDTAACCGETPTAMSGWSQDACSASTVCCMTVISTGAMSTQACANLRQMIC